MATRKANQDVNQEIVTRVESNQKYQKIPKILLLLGSPQFNTKGPYGMAHTLSAPKVPQFNTKSLSVQHIPQFNTKNAAVQHIPQFQTKNHSVQQQKRQNCCVELRSF